MSLIRKNGLNKKQGDNLMKCVFCGGELQKESVRFSYEDDEKYMLVEHVPADVCQQCGERLYAPEVTDTLLEFAQHKATPTKVIEVPIYDFDDKTEGMKISV
jgi:HTH-type transcriptional regulator / antitoxin MqsA